MSKPLEVSEPAEGTVDWKGATEFFHGKPDETETGEEQKPESAKEFRYRGKTVTVDPKTYELLEDLRREARGTNGRLGSELAQARERLARLEGAIASRAEAREREPLRRPDPLLATRDIAEWDRQMSAYEAAREAELQSKLEEKYLGHVREVKERVDATRREEAFVTGFYSANGHLDHPELKPIVGQAYVEHQQEIDALRESDPEAAFERLADLADAKIVRLRNLGKADGTPTTDKPKPPRFETSSGPAPRSTREEKPREFSTGSWVARQRLAMSGMAPKEK